MLMMLHGYLTLPGMSVERRQPGALERGRRS